MTELSSGLTSQQVLVSRAEHGSNVLTPPPQTPWWKRYLQKFEDPVIRILMIAAAIAIAVGAVDGHFTEGIGILVAIFLATFLAFWNESRAARAFDVLNTTRDDGPVKIRRDGAISTVPRRDIVVGDVVLIEVGEEVPADGRLNQAVNFQVNESRLTGEAVPVEKSAPAQLLRGTTIVDGYGLMTVTAVGDQTEIGRTLIESIEETDNQSPLKIQLARLSKIIGVVGFGIALVAFSALLGFGLFNGTIQLTSREWIFFSALTAGVAVALVNIWLPIIEDATRLFGYSSEEPSWLGGKSWFISFGLGLLLFASIVGIAIAIGWLPAAPSDWIDRNDAEMILRNFMIAVTIIVVAVPEGLAMSVTLSLAYSMRKMTASQILVRRMDACETIGAATVICSDKTGTLTMNQMRLIEAVFGERATTSLPLEASLRNKVIQAIAANSTAHLTYRDGVPEVVGNPTDGALLLWLHDHGVDYLAARNVSSISRQWSFSSERKYMATVVDNVLEVKGAPEIILDRCIMTEADTGPVALDDKLRSSIRGQMKAYQSRGMRVLALANRKYPDPHAPAGADIDSLAIRLTWLGLVAIADPVRPDVPKAIQSCQRAGIALKIITGDNAETTCEIASQIGFADRGEVISGPEFASLSDEEAKTRAETLTILSRARPADKLRLVRLLKDRGAVVAVTGDGVNDGPALNYADVGLAMGKTGTSVAREASDIILLDDSFPSIVKAVRWGRSLYENIQRFLMFQLTINVVALGLAVIGPFLGYELPLTVMQMLWVNLIMDTFAALALATEPPYDGVLTRPPRSPKAFIITRPMAWNLFGVGTCFLVILVSLIVFFRDKGLLPPGDDPTRAGTIVFSVFVLLQFWNLFNAKAFGRDGSILSSIGNNPTFLTIASAILVGQILLVQFGGAVFHTVPLSLLDWLAIILSTSLVLAIGELKRLLVRRRIWSRLKRQP
jgi:Ca2+-transporting ATPase